MKNKHKVGIITLTQRHNMNYGAYLQAWCLKKAICKYLKLEATILPIELERPYRNNKYHNSKLGTLATKLSKR